ncbi:hypothetical protein QBC37DRAFT_372649 [Rhypophila decipiens]|uniref:Zn(2)-C6 fungal-type domain-containing protein n=1 Tax=Rhypophila decipiens TaxID=261697 RepID=A0AAN6Y979_9PEZI|nr:hypothetical protein QBC37DRAFT_372649 [Rhypophila decipiens]
MTACSSPSASRTDLGVMKPAEPSSEPASPNSSAPSDDVVTEVVVEAEMPRQRCARCVRKERRCRKDATTPGGKSCQTCTTAGVLCFWVDSYDLPVVDETAAESYKALATLHADFLNAFLYNGELHDDAKRIDALQQASSSGDKNTKKTNAREAVGYDLDISWYYDLFGQTMRFMMAVEAFLGVSEGAKKAADAERAEADAERAKAERPAITERIKQLKFGFDEEEEYEPEYEPQPSSVVHDTEPPANDDTHTPAKDERYEFKIDPDTAELMFAVYTRFLKLSNLLASVIERAMKQHGPSFIVKFRGEEHEFLEDSDSDSDSDSDNEKHVEATDEGEHENKGKKNKAKKPDVKGKTKAAAKNKLRQTGTVAQIIQFSVRRLDAIRNAFDQAVEALENADQGVKGVRDMDDKARERWARLANKVA